MYKIQKKMTMSVNFGHIVLSLLYTHEDLAMQNLVGLHMIWFGVFWFGTSYTKLGITSHI